jgi:hypothetical protein
MAKREARPRLERLIAEADERRFSGIKPMVRYVLAKILIQAGEDEAARNQLELALEQVADLDETQGAATLGELLATI